MGEEYYGKADGAKQSINSREELAHYKQRTRSLKERLDDYDMRCKFTVSTLHNFIQTLIKIQKEITRLKVSLPPRDQKIVNPLLNGIRYALPVLGKAKDERAKIDTMSVRCHNLIIQAIKYLESALDKTVGS